MYKLVLLRHGQSDWNLQNRFTGWADVDLSDQGVQEAAEAGRKLKAAGLTFDLGFTSTLKRAIRTQYLALETLDQVWLPIVKDWRLNERHYGGLTGLNKAETAEKHGDEQVFIWRRSYDTPPPELSKDSEYYPGNDPRYDGLTDEQKPLTESLKDTVARVIPYWNDVIAPEVKAGKRVLIAAHGNSLRALVKHLNNISDEDINQLNIPTGQPLVFELDADLKPIRHYYLEEAVV